MTKLISELNKDELRKVFDSNEKLRHMVMEDLAESEMFWISEQLDYLRDGMTSWSIGQVNRDQHITVGNAEDFIYSFEALHKDMQPLPDSYTKEIEEAVELAEKYRSVDMYSDEFDELAEQVEEVAQDLADALVRHYTWTLDDYCLDDENICEYFLDFYADERLDDSYYVDEDYMLYEDVAYTRSYV